MAAAILQPCIRDLVHKSMKQHACCIARAHRQLHSATQLNLITQMTRCYKVSESQICGNASVLIPLGLCLPYLWRLLQCIRVHADTGNRAQLFNALKYSTAFPVIILSSIKYQARWPSTLLRAK